MNSSAPVMMLPPASAVSMVTSSANSRRIPSQSFVSMVRQ
jgi:hypothetical protein